MVETYLLYFLKKYWKEILLILIAIALIWYIFYLQSCILDLQKDIVNLNHTIQLKNEAITANEKLIEVQKSSIEIFEKLTKEEVVHDTVYKEKVIENTHFVETVKETEDQTEKQKMVYEKVNELWNDITLSLGEANAISSKDN